MATTHTIELQGMHAGEVLSVTPDTDSTTVELTNRAGTVSLHLDLPGPDRPTPYGSDALDVYARQVRTIARDELHAGAATIERQVSLAMLVGMITAYLGEAEAE